MAICLTFDTDHMSEDNLAAWLAETPVPGVGTFFCGEPFKCLEPLAHRVGPHPDFIKGSDPATLIAEYRALFPEARAWRSHSLMHSQPIYLELFRQNYTCSSLTERFRDMDIRPVKQPWGVIDFGIYYMDNSDFCNFDGMKNSDYKPFDVRIIDELFESGRAFDSDLVYVFDFHPIHVALNTLSYETYASERNNYKANGVRGKQSEDRYGVRSFYLHLVKAMKRHGVVSEGVEDIAERCRL